MLWGHVENRLENSSGDLFFGIDQSEGAICCCVPQHNLSDNTNTHHNASDKQQCSEDVEEEWACWSCSS